MSDTVCQGFPVYGVRYFGGYQAATFTNVYQESTGATQNPPYGYAAQMGYMVQGGPGTKFVRTFPISGFMPQFASGGSGTNQRSYFVVPRSSTMGNGPMIFAGYPQPTRSATNVTVTWPSIELQDAAYHASLGTLTWDVLMVVGQSAGTPYGTGTYAIATNAAVSCLLAQVLICRKKMLPRIGLLHPGHRRVTSACFWLPGMLEAPASASTVSE